jgi:predicted P-loop ATPase
MIKVTRGEDLTEDELEAWNELEEKVIDLFSDRNISADDALNLLVHIAARVAVLAGVPSEDFLEGVKQTYEHVAATIDFTGEIQ